MEIPKAVTVGTLQYTIVMKRKMPKDIWGRSWLDLGRIEIATHLNGVPRPTTGVKGLGTTFWHELTHAILYDMGNPLYKDEAFVTAFSNKLGQAVESAEF